LSKKDFQIRLNKLELTMTPITDPLAQACLKEALNLMEIVTNEREKLRKENQQLNDEINRLKGEQGKPNIKKNTKANQGDHSSENDRKGQGKTNQEGSENEGTEGKKKRRREPKLPKIKIDREVICPIDKSILPSDAVFKGYSNSVVQDIKIITDNVKYRREIYYSKSMNKNYLGKLPSSVAGHGEYGVGIRSLIPLFKSECNLSESCILGFFQNFGIVISSAYISNQWTKGYDSFHLEKDDLYLAGLRSSSFQQIDDTSARVCGKNFYTQIICNQHYSAYFTTPRKDRLTVLDVLRRFAPREFLYNLTAISILQGFKLSKKCLQGLDELLKKETLFDETSLDKLLNSIKLGLNRKLGPNQRSRIKEACAIAAYRVQTNYPVIEKLVCDNAPQFKLLTKYRVLCWIHDGRHYKKLTPIFKSHQLILDEFITKYWIFYHKLLDYKQAPDPNMAIRLSNEFNELFSVDTDYEQLNDRIAKTLAKHKQLLLVLSFPELPLHNNASELAARVQARARDVSFHTMSKKGTQIKDTFMSISQTAKKLGVRTYEYIYDRVSGTNKLPSLAQLIDEKAQQYESVNYSTP